MPFSTFAGWILPADKNVLIVAEVADTEKDVKVATTKLRRVGIDYEIGFLEGGMQAWAKSGKPVNSYRLISPESLEKKIQNTGYIEGSIHIPAPELRNNFDKVAKEKPVVLVCGLGPRAAMAASILEQQGFDNLEILSGGMTAWNSFHNKESACSSSR